MTSNSPPSAAASDAASGAAARGDDPFPTAGPVGPDALIGRDDLVASLVGGLESGTHQIVTGADKSGKTSVLLTAAAACTSAGWDVVHVDLFRQPTLERLVRAILPAGTKPPAEPAIGEAIDQLGAAGTGRRTLLVLDSFHELVTTSVFGKPADVGTELRAALDRSPGIRCLIAGSAPTSIRGAFTSKDQPFHRFGHVTTLPDIDADAWRAALTERFADRGCTITADGIDRLMDVGERHARTTMLIAARTLELATSHDVHRIDATIVDAGIAAVATAEQDLADHRVAHVRGLSKHALVTALRVAVGESPYKKLPPAMARQTLRMLEAAAVVDHPKSGTYRIADPLFRRHLMAIADETFDWPPRPTLVWPAAQITAPAAPTTSVEPTSMLPPEVTIDAPVISADQPDGAREREASDAPPIEPMETTEPTPVEPVADVDRFAAAADETIDSSPIAVAAAAVGPVDEIAVEPAAEEPVATAHDAVDETPSNELPAVAVEDIDELLLAVFPGAAVAYRPTAAVGVADAALPDQSAPPATSSTPGPATPPTVARARRRTIDRGVVRHPDPDEAAAIATTIEHAMLTHGGQVDEDVGEVSAARLGRFVRQAIARNPDRYWQVEIRDRAVGGVVLRTPGALIGRDPASGLDPITQALFLVVTCLLLLTGLTMLVVRQAWNWGAFAGLLFAAFIASTVHLALLAPKIAVRARASWAARRHGGHVVEAVWSEPDAMLPVFRHLAHALPGIQLTGYVPTSAQASELRDVGFCVRHHRYLAGTLDPDAARPVSAASPAATAAPRRHLAIGTQPEMASTGRTPSATERAWRRHGGGR